MEAAAEDEADGLRALRASLSERVKTGCAPVVGFTGTGGSGKSSVVDELVRRFRFDTPAANIGLLLVDPSARRTGGALLGDRIRLNAIHGGRVFVRSLATRRAHRSVSDSVGDAVQVLKAAGFDLVIVETAGIGQSDSEIVDRVDLSVYVMTPEFGAPSQLEKIDMIDLADFLVLNKFDRQGGKDALRDLRKQWRRNHSGAATSTPGDAPDEALPIFATVARDWRDPGTDRLYEALRRAVVDAGAGVLGGVARSASQASVALPLIPSDRVRYLADIAKAVRDYRQETEEQARLAEAADGLSRSREALGEAAPEAHWKILEREMALLTARCYAKGFRNGTPSPSATARRRARSYQRPRPPHRSREPDRDALGNADLPGSLCRAFAIGETGCVTCGSRTGPGSSPLRLASFPLSARGKTPRACSPARAGPKPRIGASICWRRGSPRPGFRQPLTA